MNMNKAIMDNPPIPKGINFNQEHELAKAGQPNSEKYIQYIVEKIHEDVDLSDQEHDILQNPSNKEKFTTLLTQKKELGQQQKEELQSKNGILGDEKIKVIDLHPGVKKENSTAEEKNDEKEPVEVDSKESPKEEVPTDEPREKTKEERKAEILEMFKTKQEKSVELLQKLQNEPTKRIQNARDSVLQEREAYLNTYGEQVNSVNGFKKAAYKIGSWFGVNKKDGFTTKEIKDTYNVSKKDLENTVFEEFASENVNERFRAKKEAARKQALEKGEVFDEKAYDEYLENVKARYAQTLIKERRTTHADFGQEDLTDRLTKNRPEFFSGVEAALERNKEFAEQKNRLRGVNLEFVTNENTQLREARERTWEANKNDAEKRLEKVSEYLEKMKNSDVGQWYLGKKWFQVGIRKGVNIVAFTALTGGTGMLSSAAFWGMKAASAAGGAAGGWAGKLLGERYLGDERIKELFDKRIKKLEEKYKNEKIDVSVYDEQREKIEAFKRTLERTKKGAIIAGTVAGGMTAGYAASHPDVVAEKAHAAADWIDEKTDGAQQFVNDRVLGRYDYFDTEQTQLEHGNNPIVDTNTETGGSNFVESTTPQEYNTEWKIDHGQGFEHSAIKQIMEREDIQKALHYNGTDNLRDFAEKNAHLIAQHEGYVDGSHERWFYNTDKHDVVPLLKVEADGSIGVHEYVDGIERDILPDQTNDIFETDVDKVDGDIYEKTHARYVPEHHIENTDKPYTGQDEFAMDDNSLEDAPVATEVVEAPPRAEVVEAPPKAEVVEDLPKADQRIPEPTEKVGGYKVELPRTYGGGPEESGYGFPGSGRAMTGGGHSVELPRTYGTVNGGGGIFEDILRMILGGK